MAGEGSRAELGTQLRPSPGTMFHIPPCSTAHWRWEPSKLHYMSRSLICKQELKPPPHVTAVCSSEMRGHYGGGVRKQTNDSGTILRTIPYIPLKPSSTSRHSNCSDRSLDSVQTESSIKRTHKGKETKSLRN